MEEEYLNAALSFLNNISLDGNSLSQSTEVTTATIVPIRPHIRAQQKKPSWRILKPRGIHDELFLHGIELKEQVLFTTATSGAVVSVYSILKGFYKKKKSPPMANLFLHSGEKKKTESYEHLLKAGKCSGLAFEEESDEYMKYDPLEIDDPEILASRHRAAIHLPSLMCTILQYSRPTDLKKEMNDEFRRRHSSLKSDLTLSKIRKVKQLLVTVTLQQNLEVATTSKAFVFFEKLILKGLVSKTNRKLVGAICLLLSAKVNDIKEIRYDKVLESLQEILDVTPQEILEHEFAVFSALEFQLHIPNYQYRSHFERIFSNLEFSNIQEYLGEKMYNNYIQHCE